MRCNDHSDTELCKLIDDDHVAREVLRRLSGLRAEAQRVPDDEVGEDQAVRRAAPDLYVIAREASNLIHNPTPDEIERVSCLAYGAIRDL